MKVWKRPIALLLCVMMALTMLAGCGDNGKESTDNSQGENEKIFFTMTSVASLNGNTDGFQDNPIYKYISEKFNIDVEVWASGWDISSEKESMWLNSGTMPDTMLWVTFTFASYYNAIDQGLIAPLPEDWETRWPNIAHMAEVSGIKEALEVDGVTYAIPHAVFGNFFECDPKVQHHAIYYRKDWAQQVGLEDFGSDYTVTLDELKEYLEKVNDAGLAKMKGLGTTSGNAVLMFSAEAGIPTYSPFYEGENGFEWNGNMEGTTEYIQTLQDWYKASLIDVDYYAQSETYYLNAFQAGQNAAVAAGAGAQNIKNVMDSYAANFPDADAYEDIGLVVLASEDGTVYAHEELNYWTTSVFSPEIDEATMERILNVMDYVASEEGQITTLTGVPGVHWEYDENGKPALIEGVEECEGNDTFILFGYCDDDYSYSGLRTDIDPRCVEAAQAIQKVKLNGKVFSYSTVYDTHVSDAKTNYSIGMVGKITEIVCDDFDVEKTWKEFVDSNKNMWEPLLKELNETYYGD